MSTLMQRLFGIGRAPEGDLATGDWSPIPATAVARPVDLVGWLSEGGNARRVSTKIERAALPKATDSAFSPEELTIIEEQRRAQARPKVMTVVPPSGARSPQPARPKPAAQSEAPGRTTWVDVLKAYAEHLTDAELHILRQQFQG